MPRFTTRFGLFQALEPMRMILHALLGIILVAAGAYEGYRQHEITGLLLMLAGLVVMDFFRERVLTIARPDSRKG